MPVLPMHLAPDAVPMGASHRVTSPGGYEQWRFDLTGSGVHAVVVLFDGCPLNPRYLRRYQWYRRWPTRVRPPVAGEYPAVFAALVESGRVTGRFFEHFKPGACNASAERLDVRIGSNHATEAEDGSIAIVFNAADGTFGGTLSLRPLPSEPALFVPMPDHDRFGGVHYHLASQPAFEVRGEIRTRAASGAQRRINIDARACHNHRFGTTPLVTPPERAVLRGAAELICEATAAQ